MKRGRLVRQRAISEDDPNDFRTNSSGHSSTNQPSLNHLAELDKTQTWQNVDDVTSPDDSSRKIFKSNESDGPSLFKPRHVLEKIEEPSGHSSPASTPCSAEIDGRGDGPFIFTETSPLVANMTGALLVENKEVGKITQGVATRKERVVISRSDTVVHITKIRRTDSHESTDSSAHDENHDEEETTSLSNDATEKHQSNISPSNSAFKDYPGKKNVAEALGIKCDMENREKHLWARSGNLKKL